MKTLEANKQIDVKSRDILVKLFISHLIVAQEYQT